VSAKRLAVGIADVLEFDPSAWALTNNVLAARRHMLFVFNDAAGKYGFEPSESNLARLESPPWGVQDFTLTRQFRDCAAKDKIERMRLPNPTSLQDGWEKDPAAVLFAVTTGLPEQTTWDDLSKSDRRKAERLFKLALSRERIWRKGAPITTDIPLLLYLIFVIEELLGEKKPGCKFPVSRPPDDKDVKRPPVDKDVKRSPGGPAFRLLQAAYAQTLVKLHVTDIAKPEVLAGVIRVARKDHFRKLLRESPVRTTQSFWVDLSDDLPALDFTIPREWTLAKIVEANPPNCALIFAEQRRASITQTNRDA
jgi:hypothetical protein